MKNSLAKILLLATVIIMDLLTGMEFDLFVPSFPQLQSHFNLTPFWVEALLSVNFIGYCLSLFFVGGLGDRYGRKPVILIGLVIFVIGSLLCLYPSSYYFLIMGRFLQGMGVAAPAILSFLIIADSYPLKENMALGLLVIAYVTFINSANPLVITLALLPFIVSQLIPSIILYPLTINFIPEAKARISAMIQGARLVLTAFALQIAGYYYQHSFFSVGIVMTGFILAAVVLLFFVVRDKELMGA